MYKNRSSILHSVLPLASTHYMSKIQYSPSRVESGSLVDYRAIRKDLQASMELLLGPNYKFADVLSCNNSTRTLNCSMEVQFNSDPKEQLKLITEQGTCISFDSEYCFIPPALTLRKAEIKPGIIAPTDPCTDDIKNNICSPEMVCDKAQDGSRNFKCKCSKGFYSLGFYQPFSDKQTIIHKCEEMCDSKICLHGTCEIIGSRFRCKCDSGYSGFNCDVETTIAENEGIRIAVTSCIAVTISSIVVPLLLLTIFIIHKYRTLKKRTYKSNYLDDDSSSISLVSMRRRRWTFVF
ncbi:uncharacterized protein LOC118183006 isoform X4 [Stegodyphus dumicola]|uniref:uncharacterized protein LOC118183006 isoform X4 n=1 Tax=Stegodyphus dumicola TaxID=202533 RepID=UPI0015ABADE1|nr:uncharacterized protein LOC118183006 isoform X4 [Stegodyphus dumicola]